MKNQIITWFFSAIIILFGGLPYVSGQSVMGIFNSGGSIINDGQMTLVGSISQTAPGDVTNGTYTIQGGFWSGSILIATAVQPQSPLGLPTKFDLDQNYPNPFNPTTTIRYSLPEASSVRLDIYNILGQHVTTLVDGQQKAGYYQVHFQTEGLSSGIYMYRLQAGSHVMIRKMLFMK